MEWLRSTSTQTGHATNLDLKEAIHGLSGDRQTTLMEAAGQIHQTLGSKAHVRSGIGAWAVGAENSVMTETEGARWRRSKLR
jgi:hypothetical protein